MNIMKIINLALSLLFFTALPIHAEGEPLKVAINIFKPPFVMTSANKQFYGFDIDMMESICKTIKRTCQFEPMHFQDLLNAVQTKKADVAVSAIIITPERAALVNFSLPYLLSYSRFLGPKKLASKSFGLEMLNNRSIGIEEGNIFANVIEEMGVQNPKIIKFNQLTKVIGALHDGKIDIALMTDPAARYWQSESSDTLVVLGKPIIYGFGLGIAVNRDELDLLEDINKALLQYQNSDEFKQDYDRYIASSFQG